MNNSRRDEGFERNKLVFGDSDNKKKTWQALLEENKNGSCLTVALYVICE
jgi:hypothetical protein